MLDNLPLMSNMSRMVMCRSPALLDCSLASLLCNMPPYVQLLAAQFCVTPCCLCVCFEAHSGGATYKTWSPCTTQSLSVSYTLCSDLKDFSPLSVKTCMVWDVMLFPKMW